MMANGNVLPATISGMDITSTMEFGPLGARSESPPECIAAIVLVATLARLILHLQKTGLPTSAAEVKLTCGAAWPSRDGTFTWHSDFELEVYGSLLAIEIDGASYHVDPDAFERDRRKDREALLGRHMETMRFPAELVMGRVFEFVNAVTEWIGQAAKKHELTGGKP